MVTFSDLSVEAVRIYLDEPTYRHEDQMSSKVDKAGEITMYTPNGTQTFDWNGRPNDSDSDQ